jgi:hypothetical protein
MVKFIFLFSLLIFNWDSLCSADDFSISLTQAFYSIDGKYSNIWFYDNTDPEDFWKHYHPEFILGFSDLQNIELGKGYWVQATQDTTLSVSGSYQLSAISFHLRQGWNSFGWPYPESQAVENALYALNPGTDYSRICRFDAENRLFEDYSGAFSTFDPGRAYYIYALRDCSAEILPLPDIEITQPEADSLHNTPDILVSGSVNQQNMTVEVNDISATVTNQDFSAEISLNEGANTITAVGTNPAGNSDSDSINVTLDTIPPPPPLLNPINSPTNENKQFLSGGKEANTSIRINGEERIALDTATYWNTEVSLSEGPNTFNITAKDSAQNESTPAVANILFDNIPPTGELKINNDSQHTNSKEVSLTISAQDNTSGSGVEKMQFSNDNIDWSSPLQNYTATKSWTLTDGDGEKEVYVKFKDTAGNLSSSYSDTIILDTIPPEVPLLDPVISPTNKNPQVVSGTKESNTSVWVDNIKKIELNDSTFWKTELFLNEGGNIFNITTKDSALNESAEVQANIFLDTTGPSTPVITDDGLHTSSATQLHASWVSSDSQTGIVEYQYAIGITIGGIEVVSWTQAGTQTEITHKGLSLTNGQIYYISVKAKNGTGIWSQAGCSDGITVNNNPPVISYVIPSNGSGFYPNDIVAISATALDPEGDSLKYQFFIDNEIKQAWSSSSTYNWTILSSDTGLHTIKVEVTDDIGGLCFQNVEVYVFLSPIELPSI